MYSALTGLMLIIVVFIGGRAIFFSKVWLSYSLTNLMLIYLVWLSVVTFCSSIPNISIMLYAALSGLPVMYLIASNLPSLAIVWKSLRVALLVIGVWFGILAIWQVTKHFNADGPLDDRNAFAALMNLIWFPSAYLLFTNKFILKNKTSLLLCASLFVVSMALFSTTSRAGIATWILLMPILLWAGFQYTKSVRIVLVILAIALVAYFCSAQFLHSSVAGRTFKLAHDESTSVRLLLWQSSIKMALAHPLVGSGWGGFFAYYPAYRSPIDYFTSGIYAHNDYIQYAVEGGFPAMLLLIGLLIGLLYQLKHGLKYAAESRGLESITLLLGVLAIFLQAGVNFIFNFAFMNVIAGLYLARAAQLVESPRAYTVSSFNQIRPSLKRLIVSFFLIMIAAPYVIYLIAMACINGEQPGLKVIKLFAPNITTYQIANLITTIRPKESVAQLEMLKTADIILSGPDAKIMSADARNLLLIDTVKRFDFMLAQNAHNPDIGVLAAQFITLHSPDLQLAIAGISPYAKAYQILTENLKVDPYHADSVIEISRLQVRQGDRQGALNTLQEGINHMLIQRYQQLVYIETLRQFAAPKIITELDMMEKQLRAINPQYHTDNTLARLPDNFYENIDLKLKIIKNQLEKDH